MQTSVQLAFDGDIAELKFVCDEAGKPNTLDIQVLEELDQHLNTIIRYPGDLRVIILKSASPKYFVVGANINALKTLTAETIIPWVRKGHEVFNRLESLPLPVLARVEGYALGGGLELAMACDFIYAADTAKFGQPEAGLGVVSGWGGSYRLPLRVGLPKAKEMFFTAEILDAPTALKIGLVDFVANQEDLDAYIGERIDAIRDCGKLAVGTMKSLLNKSRLISIQENSDLEAQASSACLKDNDTRERIARRLACRK